MPEVMAEGGFDIVIANPPYQGRARFKQDYIGDLSHFYDRQLDFYVTIPRMRHDLYQKFTIRGWELTKAQGVLTYITSKTFKTIGSKESTRNILHNNLLDHLVFANPNTFDAKVKPAIFSLKKEDVEKTYKFKYIDATGADIGSYTSLLHKEPELPKIDLYNVDIELYRNSVRSAFFKPTEQNQKLNKRYMSKVSSLVTEWKDELMDSDTLQESRERIKEEHVSNLSESDVSLFGLLTEGGQGLATGNNNEFLAYIDGSKGAEKVKERNDKFEYVEKNENQYKYMSRVIKEEHIADVSDMNQEEMKKGFSGDVESAWVPVEKGFKEGEEYYKEPTEYIKWTENKLEELQEGTGLIRNRDIFFKSGVYFVLGGFANIRCRFSNNRVIENGNLFYPHNDKISSKYLTGLINSNFMRHIFSTFINSEGVSTSNLRLLPIKIPSENEKEEMEDLVEKAIKVQKNELDKELESVQESITQKTADIYGVELDE